MADLGGAGGPGGGEMVSAQFLRGARRGGNGFGPVLKGGPAGVGGIFWPVGQKFWARGEMKTYIRHWVVVL